MILLKRFTLVIDEGRIEYVFYPVFPADSECNRRCRQRRRPFEDPSFEDPS